MNTVELLVFILRADVGVWIMLSVRYGSQCHLPVLLIMNSHKISDSVFCGTLGS